MIARPIALVGSALGAALLALAALGSAGAQGIVAGCTEIPLALEQQHLSVPYFDALTILARAAIAEAGLTPVP